MGSGYHRRREPGAEFNEMSEFMKWCLSFWKRKRVIIALPEFMYEITFYRGKIEMVKKEDYKPSGQMLYQVWYDEPNP